MRCFVAIDLPGEVKTALGALQAKLRAAAPAAEVRWTRPSGLHVTLQFLGEVPEVSLTPVVDAVRGAGARNAAMSLAIASCGAFPTLRRPRAIWAGVDGDLASLVDDVGAALAPLGYAPEARAFRAHVTLGRVRRPGGTGPLAAALEVAGTFHGGTWTAREVVLYRSHLRPTGSVYEALAQVPLLAPCP